LYGVRMQIVSRKKSPSSTLRNVTAAWAVGSGDPFDVISGLPGSYVLLFGGGETDSMAKTIATDLASGK
jgi:hypothetical protein